MSVLDNFIFRITEAKSQQEVYDLFYAELNALGFDTLIYTFITDHPSIAKKACDQYRGAIVSGWAEHYAQQYLEIDPIRQFLFRNAGIYSWNSITDSMRLTSLQNRFLEELQEAKFHDGISVPLFGPCGEVAAVSCASSEGGIKPTSHMLLTLQVMARQFHAAYINFEQISGAAPSLDMLTPRERQILKWVIQGKSNTDISAILSISESAVKFHLGNTYRKLKVNNRQSAAIVALKNGIC